MHDDVREAQIKIEAYAKKCGLDFFDTIFEMVSTDQMTAFAAFDGFPVRYPHWQFGMRYDQMMKKTEWGAHKIYEMVIQNDPSYAYLLSANSLVDQKMVIAHVYAHVDFFKNNMWFSKTERKMLDKMANHAVKIRAFMDELGQDRVEGFIDHVLALESLIDPALPFVEKKHVLDDVAKKVPVKLKVPHGYMDDFMNPPEYMHEQAERIQQEEERAKSLLKTPQSDERDILLFLMQYAPLEAWQKEVIDIIRNESYYFLPQRQTKIMNEGWASYWHASMMTGGILGDSEIIDFADRHAGAMRLDPGNLNPYKIGLELFRDIEERWNMGKHGVKYHACENMLEKSIWNTNDNAGRKKIFEVRTTCNDASFIDQYMTEEFVEKLQLYMYRDKKIVSKDFSNIKDVLLRQLTNCGEPVLYVRDANFKNRHELLLWHSFENTALDKAWAEKTMASLSVLWQRGVHVETQQDGSRMLWSYRDGVFSEEKIVL